MVLVLSVASVGAWAGASWRMTGAPSSHVNQSALTAARWGRWLGIEPPANQADRRDEEHPPPRPRGNPPYKYVCIIGG